MHSMSVDVAENGYVVRIIWKDNLNKVETHVADSLPKLKKLLKAIFDIKVEAPNAN